MGDKDEFPCEKCLVYPACVAKYKNWKEIMIREGYEGVDVSKYISVLCNICPSIDQFLFEKATALNRVFISRKYILMEKFDGLSM